MNLGDTVWVLVDDLRGQSGTLTWLMPSGVWMVELDSSTQYYYPHEITNDPEVLVRALLC